MPDEYKPNPDISLWQMAAVALVEYACGTTPHGRDKDDPVYQAVVEGRDVAPNRARYSSCGDLAHWLLDRLGLDEPWLNRRSLGHYHVGANVSDLAGCPIHISSPFLTDWAPEPGDILEIWSTPTGVDAHVCVYLGPGSTGGKARIGNYGAGGMSAAAWPGSNISDTALAWSQGGWILGHRKVQRQIRLADAVALAKKPADLTGAQVTGELLDALLAKWETPTNVS
jgi:hypothetical protein